jgi:DNA polymerase-3 subunit epsilon
MRLSEALILAFDTETTGLDTETDRVVQLGAVYWQGKARVGKPRGMLVNPGIPIPADASKVHGIHDADVAEKPDFGRIAPRFVGHLLGGADGEHEPVLCGYNAVQYDVPLLNAEFARHGIIHRIDPGRVLDPIVWVRWHRRHWRKRNLESVAERYGHTLHKAHSASADAEATGAVLVAMVAEGLVPDDLEAALEEQARLQDRIAAEWDLYGFMLYADRPTGELRLGFGKSIGMPPDQVDPSYLRFCLDTFEDIPEAARAVLTPFSVSPPKPPE